MAALSRRVAGERVLALSAAFSESLLGDEQAAFDRVDVIFARPVPRLRAGAVAALKAAGDPSLIKPAASYPAGVRRQYRTCLDDAEVVTRRLGTTAATKGLKSIEDELVQCERTLSKTYQGMAAKAVRAARSAADDRVDQQVRLYRDAVKGLGSAFDDRLVMQMREALDERTLLLRLFSVDPAGLRGFGGRGIWWQSVTDLRAAMRTVSIASSNAVRLDAMAAFNDEYDRRA